MSRKPRILWQQKLLTTALGALVLVSCGKDNKNNNNGNQEGCVNCGQSGQLHVAATADLNGAYGLLVIDKSQEGQASLVDKHNERISKMNLTAPRIEPSLNLIEGASYYVKGKPFSFGRKSFGLTEDNQGAAMQKINKSSGAIEDALTQDQGENNQGQGPQQKLPKLITIGIAPTKEVYLQFENSFIYKDAPQDANPWEQSSGYQCQFFKISGGTLDQLLTQEAAPDNLSCIDNSHFIFGGNNRFSNGIFQFDKSGNIFYPGNIPNGQNTLVFKQARTGTVPPDEVINANIQVSDFLATSLGGVFYTGQTCQNSANCGGGGGGFFRYISPGSNGQIIEIARDWYQFIYDTNHAKTGTDQAVFFGPDPLSASTASWESACLFNFDPSKTDPSARISALITCGNNIWDWMNLSRSVDVKSYGYGYNNYTGSNRNNFSPSNSWKGEFKRRCETKDQVFAGGGSQISSIKQDSTGKVYVIGNVGKKAEGKVTCSMDFRGPHCTVGGFPVLTDSNGADYTQDTCANNAGTWVNQGNCSNGSSAADSCLLSDRIWTPGYCSNDSYKTKADCEAQTGCSNRYRVDSSSCTTDGYIWHDNANSASPHLVWRTGICYDSNGSYLDQDKFETQALCIANNPSNVWKDAADPENHIGQGACTSTDATDNAGFYNNNKDSCLPRWQTATVHYDNVPGSICASTDTASRDTFYDWNNKVNNFAKDSDSSHLSYDDLAGTYLTGQMNCSQVSESGSSNNSNQWTKEYTAFAIVDTAGKTLLLRSLGSEKAIDLWLVDDVPYYSSFDTTLGQYLLNTLTIGTQCVDTSITAKASCSDDSLGLAWKERQCVVSSISTEAACNSSGYNWQTAYPSTILTNFEAYNLASTGTKGSVYADGLDFSNNQYMFGTVNVATKKISLKEGLTGTIKTIVILPKD